MQKEKIEKLAENRFTLEERLKNNGWEEQCPSRNYHEFTKNGWRIIHYFDGRVEIYTSLGKLFAKTGE